MPPTDQPTDAAPPIPELIEERRARRGGARPPRTERTLAQIGAALRADEAVTIDEHRALRQARLRGEHHTTDTRSTT